MVRAGHPAAEHPVGAHNAKRRRATTATWVALIEWKWYARNPFLWVCTFGAPLYLSRMLSGFAPVLQRDDVLVASSLSPLAVASFIVANQAVIRPQRWGVGDVLLASRGPWFGTTVLAALSACAGHAILASTACFALLWSRAPTGHPSVMEVLVGPLVVVLGGAAGALLGRLTSSHLLAALLAPALWLVAGMAGGAAASPMARRFAPVLRVESLRDASELAIRPTSWHALYLALLGLAVVVTAIGLDARRRRAPARPLLAAGCVLAAFALLAAAQQRFTASIYETNEAFDFALFPAAHERCDDIGPVEVCAYRGYDTWRYEWSDTVERILALSPSAPDTALVVRQRVTRAPLNGYPADRVLEINSALVTIEGSGLEVNPGTALAGAARTFEVASGTAAWVVGLPASKGYQFQAIPDNDALLRGIKPPLAVCDASGSARAVAAAWLAGAASESFRDNLTYVLRQSRAVAPEDHVYYSLTVGGAQLSTADGQLASVLWDDEARAEAMRRSWGRWSSPDATADELAGSLGLAYEPEHTEGLRTTGRCE